MFLEPLCDGSLVVVDGSLDEEGRAAEEAAYADLRAHVTSKMAPSNVLHLDTVAVCKDLTDEDADSAVASSIISFIERLSPSDSK